MPRKMIKALMSPDGNEPATTINGRAANNTTTSPSPRRARPPLGVVVLARLLSGAAGAGPSLVDTAFCLLRLDSLAPLIASGAYASATEAYVRATARI
jgi:hypothetical protein